MGTLSHGEMRVGVGAPADVVAMSQCGDEAGGEGGVRPEQGGAGGCRAWQGERSTSPLCCASARRTHARFMGARASAWQHNLNSRGGGCRGCSHPAQRGVGWGEPPRRAPTPTGARGCSGGMHVPHHTPGHSQQRGTERWAMAAGADPRGGVHGHTTGTQHCLPGSIQPGPSQWHIRSQFWVRRRGQRQPRRRV